VLHRLLRELLKDFLIQHHFFALVSLPQLVQIGMAVGMPSKRKEGACADFVNLLNKKPRIFILDLSRERVLTSEFFRKKPSVCAGTGGTDQCFPSAQGVALGIQGVIPGINIHPGISTLETKRVKVHKPQQSTVQIGCINKKGGWNAFFYEDRSYQRVGIFVTIVESQSQLITRQTGIFLVQRDVFLQVDE